MAVKSSRLPASRPAKLVGSGVFESGPLVSVVLTTRDRPRFLPVALACYRHQTYQNRELIVVDDGDAHPLDAAQVAAAGGKLVRAAPGTPIGTKLNLGIEQSRGPWCQKMDDDDWYAPDFLASMVAGVMERRREICRPVVAHVAPFLFFDLARWEIRQSIKLNVPGATLFFARSDWEHRPFRPLMNDEDLWFQLDLYREGARPQRIEAIESFIAVRHRMARGERGHTWVDQWDGRSLEQYLQERPLYRTPEELLPEWALNTY